MPTAITPPPWSLHPFMIKKLIDFALDHGLLMLGCLLAFVGYGIYAYRQVPIEAFPDPDDVHVQVITLWPGQAAEEIETQITRPIENALNGMAGLTNLRSISMFGLSVITCTFDDNTADKDARAQVLERMQAINLPQAPAQATWQLAPLATSTGEVFRYVLKPAPGRPLEEIRALQDWVIDPQLRQVPGVADVNAFGGGIKQYQVVVKPELLLQQKVTLNQVFTALQNNNANGGGNVLRTGEQMLVIRGVGALGSIEDISNVWIANNGGHPVYIRDVATVSTGMAPRQGVVAWYRRDRGVGGHAEQHDDIVEAIVVARKGANALHVIEGIRKRVEELNERTLRPQGVELVMTYSRSELVHQTVHTVMHNLVEGAVLILAISLLFTSNLRAAVLICAVIPLSLLAAFITLHLFNTPANLLSFGAVDFGILVDAAVVIVEAILVNKLLAGPGGRDFHEVTRHTTENLGRPMLFAKLIFITALIPIFTFQRVEGRIFRPMALTITGAMVGAVLVTLTFVPLGAAYLLGRGSRGGRENLVARLLKAGYGYVIDAVLRVKAIVLVLIVFLAGTAVFMGSRLGTEFLPKLDEGNIWLSCELPLSISKDQAKQTERRIRAILAGYPEARQIYTQLGRPDDGTDPKGFNSIEIGVDLLPHEQWTTTGHDGRVVDKEGLIALMNEDLQRIAGVEFNFSQVIEDNVEEALSGVKGELAIKLFGDDLKKLQEYGEQVKQVLGTVPGVADLAVERLAGQPNLTIALDRTGLARYGVDVTTALAFVSTGLGGQAAGSVLEGQRKFDVAVRLSEAARSSVDRISDLWIDTPTGQRIPLTQLANVKTEEGASRIGRDQNSRRIALKCGIRGRDMGSFVAEAQRAVEQQIMPKLPPGYRITWEGQFENQQRATARLRVIVPASLLLILVILAWAFQRLRYALLILANIPFAFVGSIAALYLTHTHLSVSAMIGFIALCGVSVQNGIVLVGQFNVLRHRGMPLREAVYEGSKLRVRPVLMTALMAAIGMYPAAVSRGIGSEVQRPLALVIVGGMLSAAVLTLIVLPVLYEVFERYLPAPVTVPEGLVD